MGKFQPRSYSGEVNFNGDIEDPEDWIDHYEGICDLNGWDEEELKIKSLALSFTGEAEIWYKNNRVRFRNNGDWDYVKGEFISRFRSASFIDEVEAQLQNPVMKKGESVRAYSDRFTKLVNQMGTHAPPGPRLLKYWMSGLKPSIKMKVRMEQHPTYRRALA